MLPKLDPSIILPLTLTPMTNQNYHDEFFTMLQSLSNDKPSITVVGGAGVSAESGIPTFRGPEGYWTIGSASYSPMEMATLAKFSSNPLEVWSWYLHRLRICAAAPINPAHKSLARMGQRMGAKYFALISQNVDGLHIRAGSPTTSLYEIHGNIGYMRALKAGHDTKERTLVPNIFYETSISIKEALASTIFASTGTPSHRPNVLWFDEFYDEKIYRSQSAVNFASMSDLLIIAGTSGATSLPQQLFQIAQRNGIPILEINPCPSHFTKGLQRNPANRYWPIDASRAFSFIEEILTPNRK
ncbi:MAG: Sir2 family NAD-dependent protein deacetylase [Myxococcota bacterium]|nr:Sir2 family NAD-dependent protein deacetylase [Myxococcota bacterium]